MALDKLVDSAQLDSDLEDVADAIRAKGGTSASLAFPAGFVSAIQAISTGSNVAVEIVKVTVSSDKTSAFNILTGNQFLANHYADSGFFMFLIALDNITSTDSVVVNMSSNIMFSNSAQYGFGVRTYNGGVALVPVAQSVASKTPVYNGCMYYTDTGNLRVYATSNRILRAGNYAIIMGVIS